MTIRIGNPQKAIAIGEHAATAIKAAGMVASAYGAMCLIGIVSETTSYPDIAQFVYQSAAPVVNKGAELYKSLATIAGAAPIAGDLMLGAPEGVKVGASAMVVSGLGAGLAVAGVKLSEMLERAKDFLSLREEASQVNPQSRAPRYDTTAFEL